MKLNDKVKVRIRNANARQQPSYLTGTGRITKIGGGKRKDYRVKIQGVSPEVCVRIESLTKI